MAEHTGLVTFKGNPITLTGDLIEVGAQAPDVALQKTLMDRVRVASGKGKVIVLTTAPSVDTGVCATQLRTFNKDVTSLGDDVEVWYVTRDLVFALGRFCAAEGIDRVKVFSDAIDRELGEAYGLVMKELGLLARAVLVIGRDGVVTYREIVPEMTSEPDYAAALAAAKAAL